MMTENRKVDMRGGIQELREMQLIANSQTKKIYDGYPKTKEEWIATLEKWWDELLCLIDKYKENIEAIKQFKDKKDYVSVVNELNSAWVMAPDDIVIHSNPGWNVLCDLCSESYLLEEEECLNSK